LSLMGHGIHRKLLNKCCCLMNLLLHNDPRLPDLKISRHQHRPNKG